MNNKANLHSEKYNLQMAEQKVNLELNELKPLTLEMKTLI